MFKILLLLTLAVAIQAQLQRPTWQAKPAKWSAPKWKPAAPVTVAVRPVRRSEPKPWAAPRPVPLASLPKPIKPATLKPASFNSIPAAPRPSAPFSSAAAASDEAPSPFSFSYDTVDEFGTKTSRQESGDQRGAITGSYTLSDREGNSRTVTYVADEGGFRAQVQTNEPGTISSNPAGATIQSSASRK